MIDLDRTRQELLARIGVSSPPIEPVLDVTDPRVVTGNAVVRIRGRSPEGIFPRLEVALSERFATQPRQQVIRNLLIPLRHALGNARKHGNRGDTAKVISVELILTRLGALVAVTDEGAGFDVRRTFERFRVGENYFTNQGDGFRNLHAATGPVTYENNGRTALLYFKPSMTAAGLAPDFRPGLAGADDFTNHPPDLSGLEATLLNECGSGFERCRVFTARMTGGDEWGLRAVLQAGDTSKASGHLKILTGRRHRSSFAAEVDFQNAGLLYSAGACRHVRVPRPALCAGKDHGIVLYDFHPWLTLWHYLSFRCDHDSLCHVVRRVGRALAGLHRSSIAFPNTRNASADDQVEQAIAIAAHKLGQLPVGYDFQDRLQLACQQLREQSAASRQRGILPIHGAFGWDCVHFGVDKHFYLQRFEHCRLGDPRLDLGGFAADLLCFALTYHDAATYQAGLGELLESYNARAEQPVDPSELKFFLALALVERFRTLGARAEFSAHRLLEALELAGELSEEALCPP